MAKIPTFNNLDLMESVRIQSLNPTIEAVNGLVDKVDSIPKFIGPFKII